MDSNISVIVHGGAGKLSPELTKLKLPFLKYALEEAWDALLAGKPGEFAVVEALKVMEGCEYFNAGYGGYPNVNGIVLMDVGLMKGNLDFVSLINVRRVKYPSVIALDMLHPGKTLFSVWTHELMTDLDNAPEFIKEKYGLVKSHEDLVAPYVKELLKKREVPEVTQDEDLHGTVGCVVRDRNGKLAAGTSTGGVSLKYNGRIGDTPVIGSGVYAHDEICALSTTGHGESFLKTLISGFIIGEMRAKLKDDKECFLRDQSALRALLDREMAELGRKSSGKGAVIVMPPKGDPAYTFNSEMVSIGIKTPNYEDVFIDCADGKKIRD
ncbi:MAG: hypothetical protein D6808_04925 [Candidatus Dadabacteria bacterium]|nr:MAG: hypothetical protein D6808_04925 [Candidatus Dadabacteria bacterium]